MIDEHLWALAGCLAGFGIACSLMALVEYRGRPKNERPKILTRPHTQWPKILADFNRVKVRMIRP